MRTTCRAHLICFDLFILVLFGGEYSQNSMFTLDSSGPEICNIWFSGTWITIAMLKDELMVMKYIFPSVNKIKWKTHEMNLPSVDLLWIQKVSSSNLKWKQDDLSVPPVTSCLAV